MEKKKLLLSFILVFGENAFSNEACPDMNGSFTEIASALKLNSASSGNGITANTPLRLGIESYNKNFNCGYSDPEIDYIKRQLFLTALACVDDHWRQVELGVVEAVPGFTLVFFGSAGILAGEVHIGIPAALIGAAFTGDGAQRFVENGIPIYKFLDGFKYLAILDLAHERVTGDCYNSGMFH